jgi:putative SOS response-associated peptidase YedK
MITDDPPPEIEAMGHDRCPIFLEADQIDAWLAPKGRSKEELYSILQKREQVVYSHEWLAA